MAENNYEIFLKLREYYKNNCAPLVFVCEKRLKNKNECKMYFLNTTKEQERLNYKKVFQEYLALYTKNYDYLYDYDDLLNKEVENIAERLKIYGKKIWCNGGLVYTKNPKTLGIYGELFNDFYLNIVKGENVLWTYATKQSFNERNIKGIDAIATTWEDNNVTIILSECKFVASKTNAAQGLVNDITGTENEESHVSKKYINMFFSFMADRKHSIFSEEEDNLKIIDVIDKMNTKIRKEYGAIEVFNELNVRIRFDFFAIYKDNKFEPEERKEMYTDIINAFEEKILDTGIKNYSMEIILIPIKNTSVDIKESMYTWD